MSLLKCIQLTRKDKTYESMYELIQHPRPNVISCHHDDTISTCCQAPQRMRFTSCCCGEAREQQWLWICGLNKYNFCSLKQEGRGGDCESTVMWLCILTTAASLKLPKNSVLWSLSFSGIRALYYQRGLRAMLTTTTCQQSVTFSWVHPCSSKMEVLPTISSHTMSEPNPKLTLISKIKYLCKLPDMSTLNHMPKPNREPKLIRIIWISFACGIAFTGQPLDGYIIFSVSAAFSVRPCLINSASYLADLWKERNTPHKAH